MKVMHLPVLLATCLAAPAFAQDAPGEVTKAQVAAYRFAMDAGCRNAGRQKGDPQAKIDFFCPAGRHARPQPELRRWQQAVFVSRSKASRRRCSSSGLTGQDAGVQAMKSARSVPGRGS